MTAALAIMPKASTRLFLDVERSVTGRAWRDRLDERATARALAIAQRAAVPELLARVLAGRGVEPGDVEAYLDPTVRRLMPDPHVVTAMEAAAIRIADAIMIVQLIERQASRYTTCEAAKPEMLQRLQTEILDRAKRKWLDELKSRTHLDVRL